jgi:peptidoglycan-associated lipoprotein
MKRATFLSFLVAGMALSLVSTGCKHPKTPVTNIPTARVAKPPTNDRPIGNQGGQNTNPVKPETGGTLPGGDNTNTKPITETQTGGGQQGDIIDIEGMTPDTNRFAGQTVHFDYDSFVVKTSEHRNVESVGDELKAKADTKLMIDGNCDERGTEEYNRSLGERRALAVREELIRLGIPPTDVDTISYGKDRPAEQGHDEAAWKKNRRDDFIVLTAPGK